mmetsp:Transcript_4956/g.6254  ORF Transcript_4956/g.6254 Transcript_4956/m.6254 type:complete len:205 (+) Transcript_4956:199-813(+)
MPLVKRNRDDFDSVAAWLLTPERVELNKVGIGLDGLKVCIPKGPVKPESFDLSSSRPPKPDNWYQGVTMICPNPTPIQAPPEEVWKAIVNFDKYADWNPFHREMLIFNPRSEGDETVVKAKTKEFGLLEFKPYYVDEERHIFIYSAVSAPGCRVQWIMDDGKGGCVYHSYDAIGGFFNSYLVSMFLHGKILKNFSATRSSENLR